ncbi:MAG: Txe/YoeB family addiction module toxin [Selenomonadaceae bacterium]|nr:Txe/YoeB family addiction module toxin [Selenomonadaceae bacterium]
MKLLWEDRAWDDYLYWQTQDKKTLKRINSLIKDIKRNPFEGIGKPEPLKYSFNGLWSRRIDDDNRIVYYVENEIAHIVACRSHYQKNDYYILQ